ncbi:UvrB/uvrC motif protein [compost metagenome]
MHGNTVHVGKVPKRAGGHIQVKRKLDDLRRELQYRILQEEFEEAAALRDQIRELEKQISAE